MRGIVVIYNNGNTSIQPRLILFSLPAMQYFTLII